MIRCLDFSFDWRRSVAHLLLLHSFWRLREARDHPPLPVGVAWESLLGERPEFATRRFLVLGLLARAGLMEKLDSQLTVGQLRELARQRGLPDSSHRKEELLVDLIGTDPMAMIEMTETEEFLQCTEHGRRQIESWLADSGAMARLEDPRMMAGAATVFNWLLAEVRLTESHREQLQQYLMGFREPAASARRPPAQENKPDYYTSVTPAVTLEWCYVPAGSFFMGSIARDRDAEDDERPQHRVYVAAFYIARFPTTNAQYEVFVRESGHRPPPHWKGGRPLADTANHPVTGVNWLDSRAFCHWAASVSGIPIRLPTEAEWEKAARGERAYRYPWGNNWRSDASNFEDPERGIVPVDAYPQGASPYAVHDMSGNTWEWTNSRYRPYPYRFNDGRENESISTSRVIRGGAYNVERSWIRPAYRAHHPDDEWDSALGFRVCCSAALSLVSIR